MTTRAWSWCENSARYNRIAKKGILTVIVVGENHEQEEKQGSNRSDAFGVDG